MGQVFVANCYRIIKSRIGVYALITAVILGISLPFMTMLVEENTIQNAYGILCNEFVFGNMILMFVICIYTGNDYRYKIINSEIMHGHGREEVYLGRLLSMLAISEVIFNLQLFSTLFQMCRNEEYKYIFVENGIQFFYKVLCIELNVLAYIVFYFCCILVTRNIIMGVLLCWLGFVATDLFPFIDQLMQNASIKPSTVIGAYVMPSVLTEYDYRQFVISGVISILIIAIGGVVGIFTLQKSQF